MMMNIHKVANPSNLNLLDQVGFRSQMRVEATNYRVN